ncbi:MAG: FAD binding domain-containing protein [Anaerolineales bacterium]
MWQDYYTPTSLAETLQLLQQYGARARIIAGGTDILLELEQGSRPGVDVLIDMTRVPGLADITRDDGHITLGPLVTHNHVVGSDLMTRYALPLAQACWEVGAPQIRNRATIAGNVITASPANDTITPLTALDARVHLASAAGERTVPIRTFYTGYRAVDMQPHEMLTGISFPALDDHSAGIFLKLGLRRAQAISVVDVAAVVRFAEPNNRGAPIEDVRLAIGCVAPTIIRLSQAEAYLRGQTLSPEVIEEAARIAAGEPTPIDDVRAPAAYRTEMVRVYVARALRALMHGTEAKGWVQHPAMLWGAARGVAQQALPQMVRHERGNGDTITTTVNGQPYTVTGASHKTLLHFLREDLKLTGTKEGCAEGECGACTVFIDDAAVMSCMVAAPRAHGAQIVTIEGLQQPDGALHPLQEGFVQTGAVQCGFCTPGFLMAGAKLLDEVPQPSREQIEQSISGNLCRCTGYYKILEAFEHAQAQQSQPTDGRVQKV